MQDGESIESAAVDVKVSGFLSQLSRARSRAIVLDYDGTLAPFNSDPSQAYSYPGVYEALSQIQRDTDTRLVVVTGRRASAIPPLLKLPEIEVWGCDGLERLRTDGSYEIARVDASLLVAIGMASSLIECEGLSGFAERKIASVALHWRGNEELADHLMRRMRHIWALIPDRSGLRFAPFDGGIEIRAAIKDKGDTVRSILSEMGPGLAMAYLGDDLTDEDAFGALTRRGLSILVREQYRPTLADAWIKPPEALLGFLRDWIPACRSDGYG
ncbi:MAG TPA: trehalose-phosphatase [Terracidiphilus sp.]|jgi:trehalose-phosphatase|nr:trehalose-phosphatase [Terracidiphilus sp.]